MLWAGIAPASGSGVEKALGHLKAVSLALMSSATTVKEALLSI